MHVSVTASEPDAEQGVDGAGDRQGASASSPSMATEAPAQASTAARAAGASRSSARAARTAATTRVGVQPGVQPDGLAPGGQPLDGRGQDVVGPHPVVAVVLGEQGQPDRHRVDARPRGASETRTRLPLDFDIFSPSRPTIPLCT